ncbi:hypothetical protein V5799_028895, partial [Amblyomma americanum]
MTFCLVFMGLFGLVVFVLLGTIGIDIDVVDESTTDTITALGDSTTSIGRTRGNKYRPATTPRPAPRQPPAPPAPVTPDVVTGLSLSCLGGQESVTFKSEVSSAARSRTTTKGTSRQGYEWERLGRLYGRGAPPVSSRPKEIWIELPLISLLATFQDRPLICTVGYSATAASMYPPDRYCDYLYYCNLIIKNDTVRADKNETSWQVFQNQASTYHRVRLGVSFHFGDVTVDKLREATQVIRSIAQNNIKQYGMLNVMTDAFRLIAVVHRLKDILR